MITCIFSFSKIFFTEFVIVKLISFSFTPLIPTFPESVPPCPASKTTIPSDFSASPIVSISSFNSFCKFFETFQQPAISPVIIRIPIINLIFLCKKTTSLHIFYLYAMRSRFLTYLLFNLHTEK